MKIGLIFTLIAVVFSANAAPPKAKGNNVKVIEIKAPQVQKLLMSPQSSNNPGNDVWLESKINIINQKVAFPDVSTNLNFKIAPDLNQDTSFASAHALFIIPLSIENLSSPDFWRFGNVTKIVPNFKFTERQVFYNGTDGEIQIPAGFTFGIAPDKLICDIQLRYQKGGDGPMKSNFALDPSWGRPELTEIQLNTNCNMFFKSVLSINSFYRTADGKTVVLNQSFLFIKNEALGKLKNIPLLNPADVVGDKLKEQTLSFINGLRAYALKRKPSSEELNYKTLTEDEAFSYRQSDLDYHDPIADRAIQLRTARAFSNILKTLSGTQSLADTTRHGQQYDEDGVPQEKISSIDLPEELEKIAQMQADERQKNELRAQLLNSQLNLEGKRNPFNRKGFENLFAQILKEEMQNGITPKMGQVHDWSPEIRKDFGVEPSVQFPKLLVSLALGVASKYLVTGQEENLKSFLLTQETNSVTFEKIFRRSYQLNEGDVYLSLMTIENLLSANWKAPHREEIPFIQKLQPVHLSYNGGGDKFGTWYHFVGTLVYGYVYGAGAADMVGLIETMGSQILSKFEEEAQETFANNEGGEIGQRLQNVMKKKSYLSRKSDPSALRTESYLNLQEDFRDRIYLPIDPDLKFRIRNRSVTVMSSTLKHQVRDLKNCRLDFFLMNGSPGHRPFFTWEDISIGPKKTLQIEIGMSQSIRRFRGILSDCEGTKDVFAFEYPFPKK